MPIDVIIPESERASYESWRFAPAVRHGDLVFVSGVIGQGETVDEEFRSAWTRIGSILAKAGLDYADIIDVTIFIVGLREHAAAMAKAKNEVIQAPYPAATWVGVSELIRPTARAEVKVVARIPNLPRT